MNIYEPRYGFSVVSPLWKIFLINEIGAKGIYTTAILLNILPYNQVIIIKIII